MANLVCENITTTEELALSEGKIHYHIMSEEKGDVGDILTFNIKSDLTGEITPTKDVFRITHILNHKECPFIAKGFAVFTIKKLVEAKK